jgi:hypothetical protein
MTLTKKQRRWAGFWTGVGTLALLGLVGAFLRGDLGVIESGRFRTWGDVITGAGIVLGVIIGVSVARDARWLRAVWTRGARNIVGVVTMVLGAGVLVLLVVDTVLAFTQGQSPMSRGLTGGNRGMVMFIVFTTGLALIGAGWAMARGRRVLH